MRVKTVRFLETTDLLGKAIRIYTKQGGEFHFKVTASDKGNIGGYDDEGQNLWVAVEDIDFILGG